MTIYKRTAPHHNFTHLGHKIFICGYYVFNIADFSFFKSEKQRNSNCGMVFSLSLGRCIAARPVIDHFLLSIGNKYHFS